MEIRVEEVTAEVTVPLRHEVLRPHQDHADLQRSADPAGKARTDPDTSPHLQMATEVEPR